MVVDSFEALYVAQFVCIMRYWYTVATRRCMSIITPIAKCAALP